VKQDLERRMPLELLARQQDIRVPHTEDEIIQIKQRMDMLTVRMNQVQQQLSQGYDRGK